MHTRVARQSSTRRFFSIDEKVLPLNQWPASLIDLAISVRVDQDLLLRGTGIFIEDLSNPKKLISSRQFLVLIGNLRKHSKQQDLALRFGRRLPFSCDSKLLQAINSATDFGDILSVLRQYSRLYFPLIHVEFASDDNYLYVSLIDAIGSENHFDFICEAFMSSLVALMKAQQMEHQSVQFFLSKTQTQAQLQTYLGSGLHTNSPLAVVAVPHLLCRKPLTESSESIQKNALIECRQKLRSTTGRRGFLASFQRDLIKHIPRENMTLEKVAALYGTSPATLKRRLKVHNTSFQLQLDHARKLIALTSMVVERKTNEETALKLGINDIANFRRSFKRWTGFVPSKIRDSLRTHLRHL